MARVNRKRLAIHGQVQGVGFRYSAQRRAGLLGLAGWVRNSEDGSVEAVVQGDEGAVQEFVRWARNGPSSAVVDRVDLEDEPVQTGGGRFEIRP
jgi:acylphosphatase